MENTILREGTEKDAKKNGLSLEDYDFLNNSFGRTPTFAEIVIYSAILSDHKSFKIADNILKSIPKTDSDEKYFSLGDGNTYEIKVEPNYLNKILNQPKNNKKLAQMNLLRFGSIENDSTLKSLKEIIKEISDSLNNSETTIFEADLFFDESFNKNSIVNTFSISLIDSKKSNSKSKTENSFDFISGNITMVIAEKLKINLTEIRKEINNQEISFFLKDQLIARFPYSTIEKEITQANLIEASEPEYFKKNKSYNIQDIPEPTNLKEVATFLLKNPNNASRRWINKQFNSTKLPVGNTSKSPTDAGIIALKDSTNALAMTISGNSRYVKSDPHIGTSIAVAEAARNIICSGGEPIVIATCLNFEHLNNSESLWQFENTVEGLKVASDKFQIPIADTNLSFQKTEGNDRSSTSSSTTPAIGMLGLLTDKNKSISYDFKHKGDLIFILGEAVECISSSEYLNAYHGVKKSPAPYFNIEKELELHKVLKSIISEGLINAAHDCSKDGVFIALTEMAMPNELGYDIVTDAEIREDAFLFGEAAGRVIIGVSEDSEDQFIDFMLNTNVNFTLLGHVTQGKLVIDDDHYGFIQEAKKTYNSALESLIG
ncbi:AIR synthase related protein [Brumimicrobium mesophilum]|uniref:AIR synthase related protein n=1 Tax=Brumimicrobium mesophilum TaxID=392717 RepID=UPI000D13FF0D|nr:AIR synthase related protein [Brumimicrobium mesophilum]